MDDSFSNIGAMLDEPPESARPFTDEVWGQVDPRRALDGLQHLVETIARLHREGLELHGVNRRDLALDAATGRLYLINAPRISPAGDSATAEFASAEFATTDSATTDIEKTRLGAEAVWRDARIIGELAYENFMGEAYPGGHQMAALLQERGAMAEMGLLQPGLTQVVAACVSPYGELALDDVSELTGALDQLRREIAKPLTFRVGSRSTMGNYVFRRNNQDSCGHLLMQSIIGSTNRSVGFFCVADGIGGIRDGERASQLAVQAGCRAFGRALAHYGGDEVARHPSDFARAIVQVTSQRLALQGEFDPEHNRGGTTFTCLVLAGERAGVGHVGDSRAVLVRDGRILQLTRDHTLASIFRDLGESPATAAEAETSNRTISRFLGTGMELDDSRIDGFSAEFASENDLGASRDINHVGFRMRSEDLFVLTSDGVHDEVSRERFQQLVAMHRRDPQALVDAMVQQALVQVGRDNATGMAILVE
jgi:protein phosphatase